MFDDIFIRFDTIPACDGRTDRHVATAIAALCYASREQKLSHTITPITIICQRETVLPNHMLDINATVKNADFPNLKRKTQKRKLIYLSSTYAVQT